ncbi:MAG: hypothetical protein HC811_07280 [Flammeovirgaceae bacterium]|nr:hypothetical protein [Flammeovirgaceae bacterium]
MRNVLTLLFCVYLFYSCKEVSYPIPQPSGIKVASQIPKNLRGQYLHIDSGVVQTEDTLVIENQGYHFLSNKSKEEEDWLDRALLGDSLVLKTHKGYYFFNFQVEDQWTLRVVKQNKDGSIQVLSIQLDGNEEEVIEKLSKQLPVSRVEVKGDTFYQINPTPSQLINLIDQGFFTGEVFKKIK